VKVFVESHQSAPAEIVVDVDTPELPLHGKTTGAAVPDDLSSDQLCAVARPGQNGSPRLTLSADAQGYLSPISRPCQLRSGPRAIKGCGR
jgi:hypothetical protein